MVFHNRYPWTELNNLVFKEWLPAVRPILIRRQRALEDPVFIQLFVPLVAQTH